MHEHERFDRAQHGFEFDCDKIEGFQAVEAELNRDPNKYIWPAGSLKAGQPVTMVDLCTFGELSIRSFTGLEDLVKL